MMGTPKRIVSFVLLCALAVVLGWLTMELLHG